MRRHGAEVHRRPALVLRAEMRLEIRHDAADVEEVPRRAPHQAQQGRQLDGVALEPRGRRRRVGIRTGGLAHAHHRLHETLVVVEAGEEPHQPVPVEKVVIDLPAEQPEHVLEDLAVRPHRPRVDPHHLGKAVIDDRIGAADEAEGHRRGHARVALDDVRVVPDQPVAGGGADLLDGRHRPRLEQEGAPLRVDGELEVLRPAVVALDGDSQPRQGEGLLAGEAAPLLEIPGHGDAHQPAACVTIEDELLGLRRERLRDLQGLLVDDVGVRVETRAHQPLAGAPERADHHLVDAPGVRVGGEQDAAGPRLDHALDHHRDGDAVERDPLGPPVRQGALVVGGRPDLPNRFEDLPPAADEEEAVVQPGERLPRRVLPRRRRADGHEGVLPDPGGVGGGDLVLEPGREIESEDPGADLDAGRPEILRSRQPRRDPLAETGGGTLEGPGRDRVPGRDRKSQGFEPSEIGGLAAQPRVRRGFSPRSAGEPDQQDSSSLFPKPVRRRSYPDRRNGKPGGTRMAQDPCSPPGLPLNSVVKEPRSPPLNSHSPPLTGPFMAFAPHSPPLESHSPPLARLFMAFASHSPRTTSHSLPGTGQERRDRSIPRSPHPRL